MRYGELTGHAIGVIMKETVRRALSAIRKQRFIFEAEAKLGNSGKMDDLVTTADREAQAIYVRMIQKSFPDFGIIAEEDNLRLPCTLKGRDLWFTIDPLDGTKAFGRRQSHGIGTMIALIEGNEIIAAYVGDVMTLEVYGCRPDSPTAHRISEFETDELLRVDVNRPLSEQYALLREPPQRCSDAVRHMTGMVGDNSIFKDIDITSGSIGITMARLWKGEVGAVILPPGPQKPWDWAPVIGISQRMGFQVFRVYSQEKETEFHPWKVTDVKETQRSAYELIIVHESKIGTLRSWAMMRKSA